jgi:uncharacterized membrane protein
MKNSFGYLKDAYFIIRRNFKKNWFPLLFMFISTSIATISIVLAPFAPLILIGTVNQLITKNEIKLEEILSELKITFERFFTLLVLGGLVLTIILTGYVLIIVPGVILSLSLAPVYYLTYLDPMADPGTIIQKSINLMKGNKFRYFKLQLLTFLAIYIVLLVSALINFLPIIGTIIYFGITIAASIIPTIAQILFIKDLLIQKDQR